MPLADLTARKLYARRYYERTKGTQSKRAKERYATDSEFRARRQSYVKKYSRTTKARINQQRARLKTRYRLTPERLAEMILERKGLCDICGRKPEQRLNVDHDPQTGVLRGMLCWPCNIGMGQLGHDPEKLRRAADYLIRSEGRPDHEHREEAPF